MSGISDRRRFLKGAVASTAAATVAGGVSVDALAADRPQQPTQRVAGPSPWLIDAERKPQQAPAQTEQTVRESEYVAYPGSDYMVDVLGALGIEKVALMPGATFRGLQESLANYAGPKRPAMVECVHEEIAAAVCHGYAKAAGKPMACLVHSNVGLQHASMAIYNAWCDRVPLIALVGGTVGDEYRRRGAVEWIHSAQDPLTIVRDYIKFDDAPRTLQRFADSAVRAHAVALTPPQLPVALVVDTELQELPVAEPAALRVPKALPVTPPVGNAQAVEQAADLLLAAKRPLLVADRCARTREGLRLLVKLAETLNAPVWNLYGRMNFPSLHYLNQSSNRGALTEADLIVGLEMTDLYGLLHAIPDTTHREPTRRLIGRDTRVIDIGASYLYGKSNMQDQQRFVAADLVIAADAEATLPALIAAIERRMTPDHRLAVAAREVPARAAFKTLLDSEREAAARGWDSTPISTARLSMEIYEVIRQESWAMVSSTFNVSFWPQRLWNMTEWEHDLGGPGGYGVGYGLPAAAGAALAYKGTGRIPVNIQTDGDFLMLPGTLWTLAHHEIPLLTVMHNNQAWHQETMHILRMANRRGRHTEGWRSGTTIAGPHVDYASVARGMGVWAEGPIDDPKALGPALRRALAVVKTGRPALLDVLTQPR